MEKTEGISRLWTKREIARDEVVLARMPEFKPDDRKWVAASFDRSKEGRSGSMMYLCSGVWYRECIPYFLNEEILATDADPKKMEEFSWGMKCLVSNSLSEDCWQEALLASVDMDSAYPWIAVQRDDLDEALEQNKPVQPSRWRFMKPYSMNSQI